LLNLAVVRVSRVSGRILVRANRKYLFDLGHLDWRAGVRASVPSSHARMTCENDENAFVTWSCKLDIQAQQELEDTVMARVSAAAILSAESGLSRYFAEIRIFPLLEPQEEFTLAKRWRDDCDRDAHDRLITSHLRLVTKVAANYRGYGLSNAEIISEGNLGLMQAVRRFDPDKGFRLATYAMWWIRASIQEYVLRSWSLVRIGTTVNQKKLFFKLRRAKEQIFALEHGDLRPDQVTKLADRLGVSAGDVVQMNRRLNRDASLNAPFGEADGSSEWQDQLVDEAPSQERILIDFEELDNRRSALREALVLLDGRECRVFVARYLSNEPATLEVLAREYGISRERVRQIEVRSFEKVREFVRCRLVDLEMTPSTTEYQPRGVSARRLQRKPAPNVCSHSSASNVRSITAAA
jgi:RNA polymerase sigma-32 factor